MGRHTIFVMLALTGVWVILVEALTWQSVAVGMFVSMLCMHFIGIFFKFDEIRDVSFYNLAFYHLWLISRIYLDAIHMIRMIFSDSKAGFVVEELHVKEESLRIIIADSITLTPGSIFVSQEGDKIELLCIGSKKEKGFHGGSEGLRKIENVLLKLQGKGKE